MYRYQILDVIGKGSFGQVSQLQKVLTTIYQLLHLLRSSSKSEIYINFEHLTWMLFITDCFCQLKDVNGMYIIDLTTYFQHSQVVKAYDHKNGTMVAIKIIRNKKRFHHQALVEVKLLDLLRRKVCGQILDLYKQVFLQKLNYLNFSNVIGMRKEIFNVIVP